MTEKSTKKKMNPEKAFKWRVLVIFILVIAFICGAIFIFDYYDAYNNNPNGGWLPPSFGVIFYYFQIAVLSLIAAVVLKVIYKKRVSIIAMLLAAIFVPILCYNFNYHSLKKDTGFLYPLVDKGGVFHFIVIGDYNFDGMNDERYHRLYEERSYSSGYGGGDITIYTRSTGTGAGLDGTFCFYDQENKEIQLHIERDVKYKEIKIDVVFQAPGSAEKASFYIKNTKIKSTRTGDCTVQLLFHESACATFQNWTDNVIPIRYDVSG